MSIFRRKEQFGFFAGCFGLFIGVSYLHAADVQWKRKPKDKIHSYSIQVTKTPGSTKQRPLWLHAGKNDKKWETASFSVSGKTTWCSFKNGQIIDQEVEINNDPNYGRIPQWEPVPKVAGTMSPATGGIDSIFTPVAETCAKVEIQVTVQAGKGPGSNPNPNPDTETKTFKWGESDIPVPPNPSPNNNPANFYIKTFVVAGSWGLPKDKVNPENAEVTESSAVLQKKYTLTSGRLKAEATSPLLGSAFSGTYTWPLQEECGRGIKVYLLSQNERGGLGADIGKMSVAASLKVDCEDFNLAAFGENSSPSIVEAMAIKATEVVIIAATGPLAPLTTLLVETANIAYQQLSAAETNAVAGLSARTFLGVRDGSPTQFKKGEVNESRNPKNGGYQDDAKTKVYSVDVAKKLSLDGTFPVKPGDGVAGVFDHPVAIAACAVRTGGSNSSRTYVWAGVGKYTRNSGIKWWQISMDGEIVMNCPEYTSR